MSTQGRLYADTPIKNKEDRIEGFPQKLPDTVITYKYGESDVFGESCKRQRTKTRADTWFYF